MLEQVFLGVGVILGIILYLMFFITYINNNNQKYSKTAQETVIDLLKENPNINVIKNNSQFFSKYNIKRKIVKLSNNTYDSSSYFSNAVASLLSGYELTKNKAISYLSYVFNELKVISLMPVIVITLSILVNNAMDAKIYTFFLAIILIYQYIMNNVTIEAIQKVDCHDNKLNNILNIFNKCSTLAFIITLTQILRMFVIIMNI